MKTPRWLEQPRALAALTLAFALVPAAFALISFKAARERDAKLFDTATQVLGEQLKLATYRHVSFLSLLRNQWRSVTTPVNPPDTALPPSGWSKRLPHLLAVAYASDEGLGTILLRWQAGRDLQKQPGDNLAADPALAPVLERARSIGTPMPYAARISVNRIAIIEFVPGADDLRRMRGFMIGWLDLDSICHDESLPLLAQNILHAATEGPDGHRVEISGEGEVTWAATITRGPQFSREYGTPTPWIGFVALGLSVVPLSLLVMLASRAGKLRAALEAEQLKNQFVSTVSHEFRTPLSVILSSAELLEAHAASLSETRRLELLTQIKASTNRMNEMVEQVLLLGRIESGAMKPNPQPVDVAAFCREIVEEVQTATQHRCEIEWKPCEGTRTFDVTLMRSVLTNLLTNAVKYSNAGSKVIFGAQDLGDLLRFLVADEGIGIPKADQSRIGEPFHRAANVGDVSGTGLGLTVVKRSVALCGGEFSFWSEEGQGTHVSIFLRV
ncbi:MAG: HAMP domain-containing histidine kinase [Prosthecobacter sp.]|uniref:sensor histidine kinase n=1 Tax=Prosthecobacter sp. TaxID=1965333 RepID=UPI0019D8E278|nr:HAMP domain-containing sensor histidine kinase [Prosthecobacter sp.]MBE2287278.1 HAMP domain-containing histidine kinase [Prosthecobacter sp.]